MKRKFYYYLLSFAMMLGAVSFTACGDDDDDNDGGEKTDAASLLVGEWEEEESEEIKNSPHHPVFTYKFDSNGNCSYHVLFTMNERVEEAGGKEVRCYACEDMLWEGSYELTDSTLVMSLEYYTRTDYGRYVDPTTNKVVDYKEGGERIEQSETREYDVVSLSKNAIKIKTKGCSECKVITLNK